MPLPILHDPPSTPKIDIYILLLIFSTFFDPLSDSIDWANHSPMSSIVVNFFVIWCVSMPSLYALTTSWSIYPHLQQTIYKLLSNLVPSRGLSSIQLDVCGIWMRWARLIWHLCRVKNRMISMENCFLAHMSVESLQHGEYLLSMPQKTLLCLSKFPMWALCLSNIFTC